MNYPTNLREFTEYWEQFKAEMEIRADAIFEQLWQEAHPAE